MEDSTFSLQRTLSTILTSIVVMLVIYPSGLEAGVTGKISGKITRVESGEAVTGATIQMMGTNLGSISDKNGRFFILNIPPGTYTLQVSFMGLETMVVEDVQITADLTTSCNLPMKLSILEGQEILVYAPHDVIEKDLAGTRAVITQDQFDALPLASMSDALTLQAGVTNSGDYLYIRGGRANQVAFLIDGVYVQDPFLGSFANDLGINAIQKLTLLSGTFNAEYGNAMSGIVNIVTREGGRKWRSRIESRIGTFQNSDQNKSEGEQVNWNVGGPLLGDYLRIFISGQHKNMDSYLPWGFKDETSYTSKLTFIGIPNIKINGMVRHSWQRRKNYSHRWSYIPEQYYQYESTRNHINLNLTHTLNEHLFYELRVSQYDQDYRKGIWNDTTSTWKDSSEYTPYSDYDWNYETGNGNEFYARRDPPQYTISATKTFDLIDVKASYRSDPLDESTRTMTTPKKQLSPRLGIAHPISDRTKIHFAYGHFFQNPPYAYLYNRLNYDVSVLSPVFGDPDMDAERTVAYEVGLTHQFSPSLQGRFNAFFKDITGLVGTHYYPPYADDAPDRYAGYTLIINEDYAFSKGLEINLDFDPSAMVTGKMTCTYSIAKGSASYADEQYLSLLKNSLWIHSASKFR